MAKELAEATPVPVEEPKPKKYRDEYIIPGSGFRMLVGDIHHLIVLYYSLARRLSEAETEKDFLRLKKKAGGYEKVLKKLFRSLGLPEDSNAAQDVLESPSSAAITWSAWRMWSSESCPMPTMTIQTALESSLRGIPRQSFIYRRVQRKTVTAGKISCLRNTSGSAGDIWKRIRTGSSMPTETWR